MIIRIRACIAILASTVLLHLLYYHYHWYIALSKLSSTANYYYYYYNKFPPPRYHQNFEDSNDGICVFYNFTQATGLLRRNGQNFFNLNASRHHTNTTTATTYEPITLCLHTTMDKVHHMWRHVDEWDDFISVSLLVRAGEEECLARLVRCWRCFQLFREKVSLHLVWYRGTYQEACYGADALLGPLLPPHRDKQGPTAACGEATGWDEEDGEEAKNRLLEEEKACGLFIPDLFYPYTRMHNVARRGAGTQIHLVADIDTTFSRHFAKRVRRVAQRHLMPPSSFPASPTAFSTSSTSSPSKSEAIKKVLVFRRFEVELSAGEQPPPNTIEALSELIKMGKANFFQSRYFPPGHWIPGLEEWLAHALASPHDEEIRLSPINYTRYLPIDHINNSHFEPQFLSHASAPLAYARPAMLGRHYTRQVLANELCRADYEFLLLSHVFNVHHGVKSSRTPLDLLLIEANSGPVQKNFFHDDYNAYLDARYPRKRECPPLHLW